MKGKQLPDKIVGIFINAILDHHVREQLPDKTVGMYIHKCNFKS